MIIHLFQGFSLRHFSSHLPYMAGFLDILSCYLAILLYKYCTLLRFISGTICRMTKSNGRALTLVQCQNIRVKHQREKELNNCMSPALYVPTFNQVLENQPIASGILPPPSRYKRSKAYLLADEKNSRGIQVVVWLYIYIYRFIVRISKFLILNLIYEFESKLIKYIISLRTYIPFQDLNKEMLRL